MKSFRDLKVWQKAHELTLTIYKVTLLFPADERYSLVSQIRRSVMSVPANIVEGFKRKGDKEFRHFLDIAAASLEETKYYLILALDLKYIKQNDYKDLMDFADEVGKMLYGLYKKLNS